MYKPCWGAISPDNIKSHSDGRPELSVDQILQLWKVSKVSVERVRYPSVNVRLNPGKEVKSSSVAELSPTKFGCRGSARVSRADIYSPTREGLCVKLGPVYSYVIPNA